MKCQWCGRKIRRVDGYYRDSSPCIKAVENGLPPTRRCEVRYAPVEPNPPYNPDLAKLNKKRGPRKKY